MVIISIKRKRQVKKKGVERETPKFLAMKAKEEEVRETAHIQAFQDEIPFRDI